MSPDTETQRLQDTDLDLKTPMVCHCRQSPHVPSAPRPGWGSRRRGPGGDGRVHAPTAWVVDRPGLQYRAPAEATTLPRPRSLSGSPQGSLERGPGSQDPAGHSSLPCPGLRIAFGWSKLFCSHFFPKTQIHCPVETGILTCLTSCDF